MATDERVTEKKRTSQPLQSRWTTPSPPCRQPWESGRLWDAAAQHRRYHVCCVSVLADHLKDPAGGSR